MSEDAERTLDAELGAFALELQGMAAAQKGGRAGANGAGATPGGGVEQAPIEDVVAALAVIPNGDGWDDGCGWDDWNTIGMAAWHATGGSVDGYEAWSAWSGRCADKHDELACQERWTHWGRSPPARVGIGKLAILAKRATGGTWRQPSAAPEKEFSQEGGDDTEEAEAAGGGVAGARRPGGAGRSGGGVGADAGLLSAFMRLAGRVVYIKKMYRFLDREDDMAMDEARLKALGTQVGVPGSAAAGAKGLVARLMAHAVTGADAIDRVNRGEDAGGMLVVHSMTLRPGGDRVVMEATEEGHVVPMLNLWRPTRLVPSDGDASVWVEHMARLIPNAADRERTIDRFAYALQNPGVKLNSALVLLGGQGTGKDSALVPFWAAVGTHNHAVVPGMQIGGDFNEYMQKPWLLVTEMPSFRKRSSYEEIKALLTTPPDRIRINLKGVSAFTVPNIANLIITTNHADAIALAEDDRRFDVVDTAMADQGEGHDYFLRYYAWLEAGGNEAVMGWLLRRKVTAFDPKVAPPMSEAKATMKLEAEPAAMAWVRFMVGQDGPMADRVLVTLDEMMEQARRGAGGAGEMAKGGRLAAQIQNALRAGGWASTGVQISEGDGRPRPWARTAAELYAQMDPKLLRTKVEEDRKRSAGREF